MPTFPPAPQHSSRINEIDLLRFLAALMVVFFHLAFRGHAADDLSVLNYPELQPLAQYGYLGVQLFFLISGFVILMTASSGSVERFVVSRLTRLYPAFWVCCTITFAFTMLIGGFRFKATIPQYLTNLTMLNEFVNVESIDGVYWSLAVELKFYAFVFLVLVFRQIHHAHRFLLIWLVCTIALELFPSPRLSHLIIADSAPYFIAGATGYLIYSYGATKYRLTVFFSCLLIALLKAALAAPIVGEKYGVPFDQLVVGMVVTLFFAIVLLVSLKKTNSLSNYNWLGLGALTYPLYLLHQNISYMLFNIAYSGVNRHALFWGTLILMLGSAFAVHRLVERPLARTLKSGLHSAFEIFRHR